MSSARAKQQEEINCLNAVILLTKCEIFLFYLNLQGDVGDIWIVRLFLKVALQVRLEQNSKKKSISWVPSLLFAYECFILGTWIGSHLTHILFLFLNNKLYSFYHFILQIDFKRSLILYIDACAFPVMIIKRRPLERISKKKSIWPSVII